MECNSGFNAVLQQEMGFSSQPVTASSSVPSLDTHVSRDTAMSRLGKHFMEYGSLFLTFMHLYFQGRILKVQNFILSCKLQMWELAFVYIKLQIFFVRLANGFPFEECWPRK